VKRGFWLALPWAAACSSSTPTTGVLTLPDSTSACNQAATEVSKALVGNEDCAQDSDCTVLSVPSCVSNEQFGSTVPGEVPVAVASLSSLEHTFSVIDAEVCPPCGETPGQTGGPGSPDSVPTALCQMNFCVTSFVPAPGPPGQGSFAWDCEVGCGEGSYCEVDLSGVQEVCPGWPGYLTVVGAGQCASTTPQPQGTSCYASSFCGFLESCPHDAGAKGVCQTACSSFQPPNCLPSCQLQSDNHGCNVCFCGDAGCPPPLDAG
jgi:hypothetical protein